MVCKALNPSVLVSGLILACAAGGAGAQSFQDGDLYLLSSSLPDARHYGMVRIDQSTWAVSPVVYATPFSLGQGSYDAFRDRIIVPVMPTGPGLGAVAADGTFTAIPYGGSGAKYIAASSDGRIYFMIDTHIRFVDVDGTAHDVHNADGVTLAAATGVTATWYDAATHNLFVGSGTGKSGLVEKLSLNDAGDRVMSRASCSTAGAIPTGQIVQFSAGPNGTLFVTIDDNSNDTYGRLQLFDPVAMACSIFAVPGYFGVGGETAGAYLPQSGFGIVNDTLSDCLRVYRQGDIGAGSIATGTGVSSAGGAGEPCQFVLISRGCGADFNGDGFLDFFDFNDFVTCFEGGDCPNGKSADYNGDGFPDFFDFNDFISAFEAGC